MHSACYPDHGTALIGFNAAMTRMPQWSKCMYFPQDGGIQVHQTRIQHCPDIPVGFYWYGGKRSGPGRPKWTSNIAEKGKAKQQKRLGQQNQSKQRKQSKQQKAELQQQDTPKQPPPRNPKATYNHEPVVNCRYPLQNRSGRAP